MTDAAPERITLARKIGSDEWATMLKGHTMSMGYLDAAQYVRADLASAAVRRAEALAEAESDALTTAQARIAELEAALRFYADRSAWSGRWEYTKDESGLNVVDIGMAPAMDYGETARRALEAKP